MKIWEGLSGAGPGGPGSANDRFRTAVCHGNLAALAVKRKNWGQAGVSFRLAAKILEELQQKRPSVSQSNKLAYFYQGLGKVLEQSGDRGGARSSHTQALKIWEGLSDDHPDVVEHRFNLATSHRLLGDLETTARDLPRAATHYKEALKVWERLAREHPENTQVRNAWAGTAFSQGRCHLAARQRADALSSFEKASELWESLEGTLGPSTSGITAPRYGITSTSLSARPPIEGPTRAFDTTGPGAFRTRRGLLPGGEQDDLGLRPGRFRRDRGVLEVLLRGLGRRPLVADQAHLSAGIHVDLAEAEEGSAGRVPLVVQLAAGVARDHLPDARGFFEPRAVPKVLVGAEGSADLVVGLKEGLELIAERVLFGVQDRVLLRLGVVHDRLVADQEHGADPGVRLRRADVLFDPVVRDPARCGVPVSLSVSVLSVSVLMTTKWTSPMSNE